MTQSWQPTDEWSFPDIVHKSKKIKWEYFHDILADLPKRILPFQVDNLHPNLKKKWWLEIDLVTWKNIYNIFQGGVKKPNSI